MKKLLVISYYWPPSGGAGVQRILKTVKYFPEFGIKPFVVTVREDEASYPVIDHSLSKDVPSEAQIFRTGTFEPFGVYSKLLGKKSIPTGFSNESSPGVFQKFSRFVRGNFFIPDARRGWIKYACKEAAGIIEKENIDTILTTSPPHSAQIVGLTLKEKYGLKWISDLRDPWTDIYYYNEFNHLPFAKNLDMKYEKDVIENADKIITVSNELKKMFASKSENIDPRKIIVIPNGYDPGDFQNENISSSKEEFVITYTGTIADSYKPGVFFHALKKSVEKFPDVKINLKFIGSPAGSLIKEIRDISLSENLEVIPTVPHDKSVEFLMESTALLLVIPEIENDKGILTGKLFEYLAARKPIICIGPPDGDAAAIITQCEAGRTFRREMENEITEYINELILNRKSGRSVDIQNRNFEKFSRKAQAKELSEIILKLKK